MLYYVSAKLIALLTIWVNQTSTLKSICISSLHKKVVDPYLSTLNHNNTVNSVIFSPDGQYIVTSSFDETAKVWDINGNLSPDFPEKEQNCNFHLGRIPFQIF